MEFYVFFTVRFNDGTKKKVSVYTYETIDEALASYFQTLGSYINKANVDHVMAQLTDSECGHHEEFSWHRPVVEQTEEPAEETASEEVTE